MKVLITGGSGFIGKHLVRTLLQNVGLRMILIDNLSNSNLSDFYEFLSADEKESAEFIDNRLTFHKVDIRDRHDVYEVFRNEREVDVCIHLAAKVSVIDSLKDPEPTFSTNVQGTQNVLYSASRTGTRNFVFASSAAVYGRPGRLPVAERDPTEPISPMGESKLRGEQLVHEYSRKFGIARSLRIFNAYGEGQSMENAGVITRFAHQILSDNPPIIYGDGNQTRDFISIDDVTRSIMIAAGINGQHVNIGRGESGLVRHEQDIYPEIKITISNLFNVGTGIPTTISRLAAVMIELLTGQESYQPIYEDKFGVGEIYNSFADTTRSSRILGFRFRDDLIAGLDRIFSPCRVR